MPKVLWRKYKQYSGPLIKGTVPFELPLDANKHIDRAFWLTVVVETGAKFGAVVAYDGTAITAGLDQHIAVFPKELAHEDYNAADDQGSLWSLLRRLEVVDGSESYHSAIDDLWGLLLGCSWYVAQDGVLRYAVNSEYVFSDLRAVQVKAGDPVFGEDIRSSLTPENGKVPKSGTAWEVARETAVAFHELMAHPDGFKAQVEFGKEHLIARTKTGRGRRTKQSPWQRVSTLGYEERELTSLNYAQDGWDEEQDLALCVYQSFSVNAPAVANTVLAAADGPREGFARRLIRGLGMSSYGRWRDELAYGRYQRTRRAAMRSGLWPSALFEGRTAVMPEDLTDKIA